MHAHWLRGAYLFTLLFSMMVLGTFETLQLLVKLTNVILYCSLSLPATLP